MTEITWRGIKVCHPDGRKGVIISDFTGFCHRSLTIGVEGGENATIQLNTDGPDTGEAGWLWWSEHFDGGPEWLPLGPRQSTLRIIVVYRADLTEMPRAKSEIQYGHAVASLIFNAARSCPDLLATYMDENQTKISMEVPDLPSLLKIETMAKRRGVPHALITDAGRTVFKEPTVTCLGLGPMTKTDGNALTRNATMRN